MCLTSFSASLAHLNVDKDTMIRLVKDFVALCGQGELKGNLSLACWDFSCFGHLNVAADQLDRLWHGAGMLGSYWSQHNTVSRYLRHRVTGFLWTNNLTWTSAINNFPKAFFPLYTFVRCALNVCCEYFIVHLDRVVEGLEDADALGAELQVYQALHAQEDSMVLQRLLTHQHDDTSHGLLQTKQHCWCPDNK